MCLIETLCIDTVLTKIRHVYETVTEGRKICYYYMNAVGHLDKFRPWETIAEIAEELGVTVPETQTQHAEE